MAEPALTVTLRGRLDQFQRDMDRADDIADRGIKTIESTFQNANLGLGKAIEAAGQAAEGPASAAGKTLGLLVAGSFVGAMAAGIALFKQLNENMLDLERNARRAGVTLEEFQRISFAARGAGVGAGDVNKGLETLNEKIADMGRNENELSKLLDANNVKYKERGKVVIDTNQALNIAADLIARAGSEADKVKIAQIFGFTKDWVDALREGPAAFEAMQKKADETGSVITKQTVDRAADFQKEWNKATSDWSTFFQAKLAGLLPAIDDFVNRLQVSGKEAGGGLLGFIQRDFEQLQRRLAQTGEDFAAAKAFVENFIQAIQDNKDIPTFSAFLDELAKMANKAGGAMDTAAGAVRRIGSAAAALTLPPQTADVPLPRPRPQGIGNQTVIPGRETGGGGRDPFEVEEDRIRRSIALMNAETDTIGQNSEARSRARAIAVLEEAAKRANTAAGKENTDVTDEQRKAINLLADAMQEAAKRERLVKDVVDSFKAVGTELASAFSEAIFQGKKLDDVLKQLLQRLASRALTSSFENLFGQLGGLLGRSIFPAGSSFGVPNLGSFGGLFGRQIGGSVAPGQSYLVGESGPEMFTPDIAGMISPNSRSSGAISIVQTYDARGADPAAIARLERVIAEDRRALPGRVVAAMSEAKRRSVIR